MKFKMHPVVRHLRSPICSECEVDLRLAPGETTDTPLISSIEEPTKRMVCPKCGKIQAVPASCWPAIVESILTTGDIVEAEEESKIIAPQPGRIILPGEVAR